MRKVFTLLFIVFLALASITGYLLLTNKVTVGQEQVTKGEQRLQQGEQELVAGKAKLARGKRTLSQAKTAYHAVNSVPLMGVVENLPVTGMVFHKASGEIAEGNAKVAQGEVKVKVGEGQLAAGKMELSRGKELLQLADKIRIACGYAAAFFTILAFVLGYYWRRPLIKIFMKRD